MRIGSIILAAAIAGGIGLWLFADKLWAEKLATDATKPVAVSKVTRAKADAAIRPVSVVAISSRARPLADRLLLRGRTEADRKVEVKAQTSGLIVSTPLRKGARVKKGQTLCEIERGDREAALKEAEAMLAKATSDANASRRLGRRGFSSRANVAKDAAALEGARASVEKMKLDLARTKIVSPFDGVLETDTAELGALLQTGGVCATVITLDPIKVVGFAPERVVDALKVGLEGRARLITGRVFDVEVRFVARSADETTRTFRVEATAANADGSVRDGMTAELILPLETGRAHLAPASALTLNDAGALGVRVSVSHPSSSTGRIAVFKPVKMLRDGPAGVWISGLPEKADIIVVGQEFVADRTPITVTFREAPTTASAAN